MTDSFPPDPLPAFFDRAACKNWPADVFFPANGISAEPAKRICATCPIQLRCREYAMGERYGVWGGLTATERRQIRRQRRTRGGA